MTLFWESADLIELMHESNGPVKLAALERKDASYKMLVGET